jgi:hypothetical protein
VEELVPPDCLIDYRQFSSLKRLDELLQNMTDEEYLGYADRMQKFVQRYNAPVRHSVVRLYETVAAVCSQPAGKARDYPEDYADMSSFGGKMRLLAMRFLLPHHRFVYPAFAIIRRLKKVVSIRPQGVIKRDV